MTRMPLLFPLVFIAAPAVADISDAGNACIDALRAMGTPDTQGGEILSDTFSEAGTVVMLRDRGGSEYKCIVWSDGTVGELSVQTAMDDGEGAMAGASAPFVSGDQRVQFAAGTSGAALSGTLAPGTSVTYLLGASDGQFMNVDLASHGGALDYRILNPDGTPLLDMMDSGTPYQGQLWQSGDHRIEVLNAGAQPVTFDIGIGIN